jgi:hypothetical protein
MSGEEQSLDERERDGAVRDDAALVRYVAKWERRLRRLQRAHPARWHVRGLSDDEVRDALTLRLLEIVRGDVQAHGRYERADKEWGLVVMTERLAELRRSFRLRVTPTEFDDAPLLERPPSQEQRWLELETELRRSEALAHAREGMSRPQRQWLAAMRLAAVGGEFFESSGKLNLSAASRVLGKNRSSAGRAFKELQARVVSELDREE